MPISIQTTTSFPYYRLESIEWFLPSDRQKKDAERRGKPTVRLIRRNADFILQLMNSIRNDLGNGR